MSRLLTTTQTDLWDVVQDAILDSNTTTTRIMTGKTEKWNGTQAEIPVKVEKNNQTTFFRGMQTLANAPVNTRRLMTFDPTFLAKAVALPFDELSINATQKRVIDLMAVEIESATQDLADDMGDSFFGDGLGDDNGFSGTGYLIDDGSVSSTIGGLSRASYPMLDSYVSAVAGGVLSLDRISTAFNAAASGSDRPTMIATSETTNSLYEKLLTPQDRMNKTVTFSKDKRHGSYGYNTSDFRGVPVVYDEKCPVDEFILLNEGSGMKTGYRWHGLKIIEAKDLGVKSNIIVSNDYENATVGSDLGFSWGEWVRGANVAGKVSYLYCAGQFIAPNPKRNSKLTGITTT